MKLTEKVTLEQRFEDGEGISHMDICDKSILDEGRSVAKTWGWIGSSKFKKQPGRGHWSGPEWGETQELRSQMKPVHHQPASLGKSHSEITPTVTKSKPRSSQSNFFFFHFPPSPGDIWTMSEDSFGCCNWEVCLVTQSCPTLCDPMDCSPPGFSTHEDSPGKNTGVGCHSLLQGIFPTQGLNLGLLHCRADSLLSKPPAKNNWEQRAANWHLIILKCCYTSYKA